MKKWISLVLAAAVTASAFTIPAAAEEAPEVTLTYWGWDSNFYEPMMAAYSELHPNVHFEPTATEWGDMLTKAQQALASGSDLPTLIPMDRTLIGNWKKMDIMEDLTPYGVNRDDYNQALIDLATTDDGAIIGLFENVCPSAIAYKRDLAEQYLGTSDPAELQEMFKTYEDYYTKGAEVAEASNGEVFLFHSGQTVSEWFYFASDIANLDGDKINATAKYTDVFEKLIALRDAGACDTYQNGTPEANATYAGKNHIMYPCPDWALTYYIESNDPDGSGNWGLIHAPVDYQAGGTALGITKSATDEQKAAAYDFIHFCISDPEGAAIMRDKAGYITSDETIATEEFCVRDDEEFFGGQEISKMYYLEIAPTTEIAPATPYDNDMVTVRNDVAQLLMDDPSMTLEDAVAAAIEELSQLITDDTVTIE